MALDDETYGQVWHLPVNEPVTVEKVVSIFKKVMGTNDKAAMMPRFLLGVIGVIIPPVKELKVTALEDGIKAMVESFKHKTDK